MTRTPPAKPQALQLDDGNILLRAPDGLEIRFAPTGEARQILRQGRTIMTGAWPGIFAPPMRRFQVVRHEPFEASVNDDTATVEFRGTVENDGRQIDYIETCIIAAERGWETRMQFSIRHDLDLRIAVSPVMAADHSRRR